MADFNELRTRIEQDPELTEEQRSSLLNEFNFAQPKDLVPEIKADVYTGPQMGEPGLASQPMETPEALKPREPSLFERISQKYQEKTPELTAPPQPTPAPVSQPISKPMTSAPTPQITSLPQAAPSEDTELMDAQKAKGLTELVNRLGKSAELFGTAISRTKPVAQEAFDSNIKAAGVGVEDLLQRRKESGEQLKRFTEKDLANPNSEISQLTREMAKKALGKDFGPGVSALQLKAAGIDVDKMLNAYNMTEERKLRASELKSRREDDKDIKYTSKFNEALNKLDAKKKEAKQYIDTAYAQAEEAVKSPAAAALLGRSLTKAVEGAGARVSDKDAQTALRAGGVREDIISWLDKGATGTIPRFQADDIRRLLTTMRDIHDSKFKEQEDQMVYRQSKMLGKPEEKVRQESFMPETKAAGSSEVERLDPKTNKIAVFDKNTKQFLRWK